MGNIKFGMSPSEVIEEMSEEQVFEGWMGGNRNNSLLYKGIMFGFDKCDAYGPLEEAKLCDVTISSREDVFLFDIALNDWNKEELIKQCEQKDIEFVLNKNGDIDIPALALSVSFDIEDDSVWFELWKPNEAKTVKPTKFIDRIFSIFDFRR